MPIEYRAQKTAKDGNWNAYMKELDKNTVSTIDPRNKQKKKEGTSFNNSKRRRRRELKKEETCIEGRGIPLDAQNTSGVDKRGLKCSR